MPSTARRNGANPYNHQHRLTRAALIRQAIGTPCPGDNINGTPYRSHNCTRIMTNPRRMHLAHTTPVALGGEQADTIVCAPCNQGAGAILGNLLRNTTHQPKRRTSRQW